MNYRYAQPVIDGNLGIGGMWHRKAQGRLGWTGVR